MPDVRRSVIKKDNSRASHDNFRRLVNKYTLHVIRREEMPTERVLTSTEECGDADNILKDVHMNSNEKTQGHICTEVKHSDKQRKETLTSLMSLLPPHAQKLVEMTSSDTNKLENGKESELQFIIDLLARHIITQINTHDTSSIQQYESERDMLKTSSDKKDEDVNFETDITNISELYVDLNKTDKSDKSKRKEQDQNNSFPLKRKLDTEHRHAKIQKSRLSTNTESNENVKNENKDIDDDKKFDDNTIAICDIDINSNIITKDACFAKVPSLLLNKNQIFQEGNETSISQKEVSVRNSPCHSPSFPRDTTPNDISQNGVEIDKSCNISKMNQKNPLEINKSSLQNSENYNKDVMTNNYSFTYSNKLRALKNANSKLLEEQKTIYGFSSQPQEPSQVTTRMDVDLKNNIHDIDVESCISHSQSQNLTQVTKSKDDQENPKLRISKKYQQNVNVTHYTDTENSVTQTIDTNEPLRSWYLPPEPTLSCLTVNETTTNNWLREIDPSQVPVTVMNNFTSNYKRGDHSNVHNQVSATTSPRASYLSNPSHLEISKNHNGQASIIPDHVFNSSTFRQFSNNETIDVLRNNLIAELVPLYEPINNLKSTATNITKSSAGRRNYVKSPILPEGHQSYINCSDTTLLPNSNDISFQTTSRSLVTNSTEPNESDISKNKLSIITKISTTHKHTPVAKAFLPLSKPAPYIPSNRKPLDYSKYNQDKSIQENFEKTLISLGLASIPPKNISSSSRKTKSNNMNNIYKSNKRIKSNSIASTAYKVKGSQNLVFHDFNDIKGRRGTLYENTNCPTSTILYNTREPSTRRLDADQTPFHSSSSEKLQISSAAFHTSSVQVNYTIAGASQKHLNVSGSKSSSELLNVPREALNLSSNNPIDLTSRRISTQTKHGSLMSSRITSNSANAKSFSSTPRDNEVPHNNIIKAETTSRPTIISKQHIQVLKCLDLKIQNELKLSNGAIPLSPSTVVQNNTMSCITHNNASSSTCSPTSSVPLLPLNISFSTEELSKTQTEETVTNPKPLEQASNPQKIQGIPSSGSNLPDDTYCSTNISQKHLEMSTLKLSSSPIAVSRTAPSLSLKSNTHTIIKSLNSASLFKQNSTSKKHVTQNPSLSLCSTQMSYNPLSISKTARSIIRKKHEQESLPSVITNRLQIVHIDPESGFGVKVNRLRPFKPYK